MKHQVVVEINNSISVILELDDSFSPQTVSEFIDKLPFTVDLNVWGDEIYTSESPISQPEENAKSPVNLMMLHIGRAEGRLSILWPYTIK